MYPFDRFSESAKEVLTLSQEEAERAHHSWIGTEHLVLGLMRNDDGLAARALKDLGLELPTVRSDIERALSGAERSVAQQIIPTSRVKRIIEIAFEEASRIGQSVVGTDSLLLALLVEGHGIAAHLLLDRGLTVDRVRAEIGRLRREGVADRVRSAEATAGHKHRHVEVADGRGRPVRVDITFPTEYSDQECEALAARIRSAITPAES